MIIDLNICTYSETSKSCSGCLCFSCVHHVPFGGCVLQHVDCDISECHAIGKCMAFVAVPEKGFHS